jgi:hypothetical protein
MVNSRDGRLKMDGCRGEFGEETYGVAGVDWAEEGSADKD